MKLKGCGWRIGCALGCGALGSAAGIIYAFAEGIRHMGEEDVSDAPALIAVGLVGLGLVSGYLIGNKMDEQIDIDDAVRKIRESRTPR